MGRYRIGIDVGGTFTDFVIADGATGRLAQHKEPSVPSDPARAVVHGIAALLARQGADGADVALVVHGTTLALNAIVQQCGARVALVVSRGNRDVLEIARSRLPSSYDFTKGREAPMLPREDVFEVSARLLADGTVLRDADPTEIAAVADAIAAGGYAAAAVMLLNSYRDPTLERRVVELLRRRLDGVLVTASAEIWPELREYERALLATMNAYVHPLMATYLDRLEAGLQQLGIAAPLHLTTNSGGTVSVATARTRPIDTILSGPASGVLAAARVAGAANLVTFDMGGTSTDTAVSRGGASELTHLTMIGDYPLMLPVVNVRAIGAGGGSIVWVDAQGALKVGPESVGAEPGPVCYGQGGTRPAITDCYLVLGWLDPERFLDGRMRLDVAAAKAALGEVAAALGLADAETAAAAALRVATARMVAELVKLLAEKGLDPRDFTLVAYGGAGPTHACLLAEEARLASIVVPRTPGTFCALGAILADVRRDYVRPVRLPLDRAGAHWQRITDLLGELEAEAAAWVAGEGALVRAHAFRLTVDMRYPAQAFELNVAAVPYDRAALTAAGVIDAYEALHQRLYGFVEPDGVVEVVNLRLAVVGELAPLVLPELPPGGPVRPCRQRRVVHGGVLDVPVYRRDELGAGAVLDGPALVDQPDSTVWILPGWRAQTDALGNLVLRRTAP